MTSKNSSIQFKHIEAGYFKLSNSEINKYVALLLQKSPNLSVHKIDTIPFILLIWKRKSDRRIRSMKNENTLKSFLGLLVIFINYHKKVLSKILIKSFRNMKLKEINMIRQLNVVYQLIRLCKWSGKSKISCKTKNRT